MIKRLLAVLLASAALPAAGADFSSDARGTSGSGFLLLDTDARGIALGGAMAAISNDASSLYWNPAGLSRVPRLSATFMHARHAADISYNTGAWAQRISDVSVVAAGMRYLDAGSLDRTDINGANTGTFKPRAFVAEIGWGQEIFDLSDAETDVAMGASAKAIRTDLVDASANGYGGDLGLQARFYTSASSYDLGVAVQNLGMGQKFDKVRDTMPMRLRFAGAAHPLKPVTLSLEAIAPINDAPHGALGLEYASELDRTVRSAARVGINSLTYKSLGAGSCVAVGLGLSVSDLSIDYAFVPMGVLASQTHRVSINFNLPAKASRRGRER